LTEGIENNDKKAFVLLGERSIFWLLTQGYSASCKQLLFRVFSSITYSFPFFISLINFEKQEARDLFNPFGVFTKIRFSDNFGAFHNFTRLADVNDHGEIIFTVYASAAVSYLHVRPGLSLSL
jgi:hypothetical protein